MYPQNIAQAQQGGSIGPQVLKVESPIRAAQTRLDNAMENLFKTITVLEQRLYPVISPVQQAPDKSNSETAVPDQISQYIELNATGISIMTGKLATILERLELP